MVVNASYLRWSYVFDYARSFFGLPDNRINDHYSFLAMAALRGEKIIVNWFMSI